MNSCHTLTDTSNWLATYQHLKPPPFLNKPTIFQILSQLNDVNLKTYLTPRPSYQTFLSFCRNEVIRRETRTESRPNAQTTSTSPKCPLDTSGLRFRKHVGILFSFRPAEGGIPALTTTLAKISSEQTKFLRFNLSQSFTVTSSLQ